MKVQWRGQLSLPVRCDAATMVDAQVARPASWRPDPSLALADLDNTRVIRHLQVCATPTPPGQGCRPSCRQCSQR